MGFEPGPTHSSPSQLSEASTPSPLDQCSQEHTPPHSSPYATCLALRLTPGREKEAGVPFFHPGPKCGTDASGAQITPAPAHGVGISYREVSKQIQGYCQHPPPTLLPPRHSAPRARVSPKRQVHHCPHPQHKSWGSESAQEAKQTL